MIAAAVALLLVVGAPNRLPPVDRCGGDPAFVEFRRQLATSVARKDPDALFALMADDVRASFGGGGDKAQFRKHWDREGLWGELGEALSLGCAKAVNGNGKEYRAFPAMFVTGDDLDGFTTWLSRPGASLRAKPSANAALLQRLPSWTVLQADDFDGGAWITVRTPKGRSGFVKRSEARSLIDYRLIAERQGGRWVITAFVAGD